MNKQTFIQLIKDPSGISPEQLLELEKVVAGFPYCQSAHIMIAKQAHETGSMLADQKLKKASAYTLDRKNLKRLLSGNSEKELPDLKYKSFQEISSTLEPLMVEKEPIAEAFEQIQEEKETLSVSSIIEEKNPSVTESMTDAKRDEIIRELQENLKRLHDSKIKAAWEDIPEKINVIGVTEEEPVSFVEEQTSEVQEEVSNHTDVEEISEILPTAESTETIKNPESSELSTKEHPLVNFSKNEIPAEILRPAYENPYPIRTEDVVVELKETEADSGLMIEYLRFLEEKRSVFRKNKKKEGEIIEKIIKEDPTIPKLDINNLPDNSVDLSTKSITIAKGPVSENFAKILSLQGKRDKAIEIYEQLILKNPEKKPYFEAQIEKLKNRI